MLSLLLHRQLNGKILILTLETVNVRAFKNKRLKFIQRQRLI